MQLFVVSLFGGDYATATLSSWAFTILPLVNRETALSFYLSWNFMTSYIIYLRTYYLKRINMKSIACFLMLSFRSLTQCWKKWYFSFFNLTLHAMSFVITSLVASLARISWNWRHHNQYSFCFVFCFFYMTLKIHKISREEGCHFWFLSTTSTHFEHLPISRTVTADSSPLHIPSDRIRKGNLWFPRANC